MNGTLSIIGVWLIVSGLLLGVKVDQRVEKCGGPIVLTNSDVASAMLWPVLVISMVSIDREDLVQPGCENGDER